MSQRVTIAQVAESAGVSAMTVSNVLNGRPGASESTRQRVLASAEDLGYVPNIAARRLKAGHAGLVGISVPDLRSSYTVEIVTAIADEFDQAGVEALISIAPREDRRIEMLSNGLADALVVVAPAGDLGDLEPLGSVQQPVVLVDPALVDESLPCVVADDYGGMRMLTSAVLAAGHVDILYLQGEHDRDMRYRDRRGGFTDTIALDGEGAVRVAFGGEDAGYEAALEVVLSTLDAATPTAIVAASDEQAFGAIDAVRSRGLRVPEDVSVVGFGDSAQAAQSYPGLTTVRRPLHEMGRMAARTVLGRLQGVDPVQNRIELHTSLVERGTLAPVNRSVYPSNGG